MSELLAEAGVDIVAVVDPMTSQIGPDHFAELCTPHARRIFDRVRELSLKGSFFVCGHAQKNVEAIAELVHDEYARQVVESAGAVPTTPAVEEWVKQLDE